MPNQYDAKRCKKAQTDMDPRWTQDGKEYNVFVTSKTNKTSIMVHVFLSIAFLFGYSSSVQADNFEEALRLGITNSNALRESRQDYLSARQELIIAGSDKDFYGRASISQNQAFYERPNDGDDAYGSSTLSGAITFTKQLYNFGETKAKQDAAAISIDIAKAGYSTAEQSVLISLIQSYLAVILSQEEVDLHQSNFERLTEQTNAEELRVEAGVSTLANLALATSKRSTSRSDLISAKAGYQTAVEEYESLIGVLPEQLATPKLPDLIPVKVQLSENLAYENHPNLFLATATQRLAAIQQEILVKALGPSVDLSLSAKKQNTGGIAASDGNELSANISVSVPILVTPSTMAQTQKLISDVMSAQYQRDEVKRSIGLAARAGFRNHVAAKIQHKASKAEVEAYQLVVDATKTEVEFGNKTFLDQLDSEDDLKNAKLRELRASHSVLLTGYQLLQSIGALTAQNLGVGDALIPLEALEVPGPEVGSIISVLKYAQPEQ